MQRFTIAIISLLIASLAWCAPSAEASLDKCASKLSGNTLSVGFVIKSDGQSVSGQMTLQKNKFIFSSAELGMWFDGKTLWSFAKRQNEINISTPEPSELQMLNPVTVINGFKHNFTASPLKSTTGETSIKLTPKKKGGDIDSAVINIDPSTNYPNSIIITLSSRKTLSIKITSIKAINKLNDASFRFNKSNYPNVEVIDLR